MCPVCFTTAALIASSATSTGGLTALAIKRLCPKPVTKKINQKTELKGEENGTSENRITK